MPAISFHVNYHAVLNYAMHQNRIPVVRTLAIQNDGPELRDVELHIASEPAFLFPYTKPLSLLPEGQYVDVGAVELQISPDFLAGLTERMAGVLKVELAQGEMVLHSQTLPVDLLAFDEWGGLGVLPEMIAAFVTPNHEGLTPLVKQASELLGQWTGDPSLNGYQSKDANRARYQAAAVYQVLQSLNITYSEPPASFEASGQRVRMNGTVLETRMGTCLDLTILAASLLEALGLFPLIVFTPGHAFAGVWLEEECFAEAVQDDASALTKRVASGVSSVCVFETTAATAGRQVGFEQAESLARDTLAREPDFFFAVDVKRARAASVRPLPERVRGEQGWRIVAENRVVDNTQPGLLGATAQINYGKTALTKQQQWERRLLDLSLRNSLINLRFTKTVLPLLTVNLHELEDALSSGDEFQVMDKPMEWQGGDQAERLFRESAPAGFNQELLRFEFERKRLRSPLTAADLAAAMTGLYRTARTALEENGANTLYLALGLLKWYETPSSQKPRFAPLVLIPIEILRKSALRGYVIRLREDEPQMNITLLEMLKQDFGLTIGGLDPLPQDENGVDVQRVLSVMRQAVMSHSRWDVLEEALIGIFSFSQFVMWNDIRNRSADLARNKVVSSLLSGRLSWVPEEVGVDTAQLDTIAAPERVFVPVTADASQLEAIVAAGSGKSFVLHGPPGTGKSQTITNIISNALATGKTVLFVAEKMAALSVVQRRLEAVGIGPFCLELHSNKSKKKEVLEQLNNAATAVRTVSPQDFAAQAARLAQQRDGLNAYVQALHRQWPFGFSLYDAISGYGVVEQPEIECLQDEFAALTAEELMGRAELCESLVAAARNVGHPSGNPLAGIGLLQYSQGTRAAAGKALGDFAASLCSLGEKRAALCGELGEPAPCKRDTLQALSSAGLLSQKLAGAPSALVGVADLPAALSRLGDLAAHGQPMSEARQAFLVAYREEALGLNGALLLAEWQKAELQWFLPKTLAQGRIVKALQPYGLGKVNKAQVEAHLKLLTAYQAEKVAVDSMLGGTRELLGSWWQGHDTNWETIRTVCGLLAELDSALARAGLSSPAARKALAEKPGVAAAMGRYAQAWCRLEECGDALSQLLAVQLSEYGEKPDYLAALQQKADAWQANLDDLREWAAWNKARAEALSHGLGPVVAAYDQGMPHGEVVPCYLKGRFHAAAEWIISRSAVLQEFSGAVFEDRVRQFKNAALQFEQLTRQELYARLASRIPNFTIEAAQNSELGILQRAIRSGGRGLSIRQLFQNIPNLLPRLAPCMLMSPISVAQYLDPGHAPFDLVVFDEASQLPTCKAVGAIARGTEVVVVGDPKQLPPTSFFATNTSDEEDFEIEDLESILEDCLALSMPQASLLWHYRSRHESLIAFSNSNYYDNKLLTFPSPRDRVSSVRHVHVPGVYDRGGTKQNRAEAEAIVAEIVRRLEDGALRQKSMGVVTFSSVQQNLIDDLLSGEFVRRPDLEEVALHGIEPLFVKNLENVQGDERDVILFSVGYGPDKDGKVTMNFGPLNREGGWRRLNVAVSRAREEMVVYSTLLPDQLDVSRTAAKGVAGLKAFLEYAIHGKRTLTAEQAARMSGRTGVETQIANALRREGYQVDTNVGCSGYRISAAVLHPEKPGEYALGILCDGENYRLARTARDRELAQEAVLSQLGWNIHRVWALDWWDNPAKETRKLCALLGALIQKGGSVQAAPPSPPVKIAAQASAAPPVPPKAPPAETLRKPYQPASLQRETLSPEEFLLPQNASRIARKIAQAVNEEGPLSRGLLCTRVLQSFGISRMGSRIERTMTEILSRFSFLKTEQNDVVFYWPADTQPGRWECYRTTDDPGLRRDAADLPAEETASAVRDVLRQQIALPAGDLVRESAKLMGYSRLGPVVEQAFQAGIVKACERGWAQVDGKGNVRLSE